MCFLRNNERTLNFLGVFCLFFVLFYCYVRSETRIGRPQVVKVRITSNNADFVKAIKIKCV